MARAYPRSLKALETGTMIDSHELPLECGCEPFKEEGCKKRPYTPPVLVIWGAITELTAGAGFSYEDGDFTGSGGT